MSQPAPLRSVHLCAGVIGVFADLLLNHTPVGLSEINPYAIKLAALRYPGAKALGDLNLLTADQILELKPDVLCAGWPCTNLSRIGNKEGMKEGSGTASALIWPILNLVRGCVARGMPIRRVFLENVSEVVNSPDFPLLLKRLHEDGYKTAWGINSCDQHVFLEDGTRFSFPHKRQRFWLLAQHVGRLSVTMPVNFFTFQSLVQGKNWTTPTTRARGSRTFFRPEITRAGHVSKTAGRVRDDLETQAFIEHERRYGLDSSKGLRMRPEFVESLMGVDHDFTNINNTQSACAFGVGRPAVLLGRATEGLLMPILDRPENMTNFTERHFVLGNSQNPWQAASAYRGLEQALNQA